MTLVVDSSPIFLVKTGLVWKRGKGGAMLLPPVITHIADFPNPHRRPIHADERETEMIGSGRK